MSTGEEQEQPTLPVTATPSPPKRFTLDDTTKVRIQRIFTPTSTEKVKVAWNFVRREGKVNDDEIADAHARYISDLPLPPIKNEILHAIEAARKVGCFSCVTVSFNIKTPHYFFYRF